MRTINAVRVGSSNHKERMQELYENHEKLQKMIDEGWQIKPIRVKRQRIHKEKTPRKVVVTLGGDWTVTMSFEEYKKHGEGLKIVMRIY
jgi:hypothetical protein